MLIFDAYISAFAFFGVDVGDTPNPGQLSLQFEVQETMMGEDTMIERTVPHDTDANSGGVIFFGIIDEMNPFKKTTFTNIGNARDGACFACIMCNVDVNGLTKSNNDSSPQFLPSTTSQLPMPLCCLISLPRSLLQSLQRCLVATCASVVS